MQICICNSLSVTMYRDPKKNSVLLLHCASQDLFLHYYLKLFCKMKNKLILFGLFFALLQATVYGKRNEPDPSIIDEPLKINVDAGKERDSCMSLAKTTEEKQSLIDDALKRMTAKIEALEERITAEAKATEDRCTQR
uniref:Chaperone protein DnaK n=1 Tax=Zeugodacus cucurbitae TaxID=28588 RepID=A0A0A1XS47_ZEUCU